MCIRDRRGMSDNSKTYGIVESGKCSLKYIIVFTSHVANCNTMLPKYCQSAVNLDCGYEFLDCTSYHQGGLTCHQNILVVWRIYKEKLHTTSFWLTSPQLFGWLLQAKRRGNLHSTTSFEPIMTIICQEMGLLWSFSYFEFVWDHLKAS